MTSITLYTMPNCPHCERAKEALDSHGYEYRTVSLSGRDARHTFYDSIEQDMKIYPEHVRRTMPKLLVGDTWVPSADDIVAMLEWGIL